MFCISLYTVYTYGKENYIDFYVENLENISIHYDKEIINCTETKNDNIIHVDITSKKPGKTEIILEGYDLAENSKKINQKKVFVHKFGIITINSYFGYCNGDVSFSISIYIILILIIIYLIKIYKKKVNKTLFSYSNVTLLGLILFISTLSMVNTSLFIYDIIHGYFQSISNLFNSVRNHIYLFMILIFPMAFILTILATISNIILLKAEGKRWTNMLGTIMGGFFCLSTLVITLFNNAYINHIVIIAIIDTVIMFIIYLECVFFGTCVLGIKAARHIPSFDKDAILILGCKIKKDGTLTNLLKARVDRAIEFKNMQKEKTGKDILFVPSGGKGSDEVISEAQAMKNYLLEKGIKEENILLEDKSKNTFENIKFSNVLIKDKIHNAKIAFSTTNYHVFRAGIIANEQNIELEGIGAKTKTYYWINAFIREFVATLVSEKKNHLKILLILIPILGLLTIISYF